MPDENAPAARNQLGSSPIFTPQVIDDIRRNFERTHQSAALVETAAVEETGFTSCSRDRIKVSKPTMIERIRAIMLWYSPFERSNADCIRSNSMRASPSIRSRSMQLLPAQDAPCPVSLPHGVTTHKGLKADWG